MWTRLVAELAKNFRWGKAKGGGGPAAQRLRAPTAAGGGLVPRPGGAAAERSALAAGAHRRWVAGWRSAACW